MWERLSGALGLSEALMFAAAGGFVVVACYAPWEDWLGWYRW